MLWSGRANTTHLKPERAFHYVYRGVYDKRYNTTEVGEWKRNWAVILHQEGRLITEFEVWQ